MAVIKNLKKISNLIVFTILVKFGFGLGFEGYYSPVDPISCDGLETFEDSASYLRDVYVVSNAGSGGDGTLNSPYNNLETAASNSLPGDIIHMTGNFQGGIYITGLTGTSSNPIQILGENTLISGTSNCAHFVNSKYVVFRNIECNGGTTNGINVDDGGQINDNHASEFLIFDNIKIHNVGSGGNQDPLKLSGLNNFIIINSHFYDNTASSSGIDMVGCHDGIIINNSFENMGDNFIQAKGGSKDITIHGNYFKNSLSRGINLGGSTGFPYFRPPLEQMEGETKYESKHLRLTSNIFINPYSSFAFVNCEECLVANNLFYKPSHWIFRILQEMTTLEGYTFHPTRRGEFVNNIIVFEESDVSVLVNIGTGTAPETFRIANNIWYASDNSNYNFESHWPSGLPMEINPHFNINPMFVNEANEEFNLQFLSPAIGNGETGWVNTDFDGTCFYSNDIGPYANKTITTPPVLECEPIEKNQMNGFIIGFYAGTNHLQDTIDKIILWKEGCD